MKERVEAMISYIFGKYDMRKGENNRLRMQKLAEFCLQDIGEHPKLKDEPENKPALECFVIQSIIYMMNFEVKIPDNTIIYDGLLTPQAYLEIMTGKYFILNTDNQIEAVENILDKYFGEGEYWSYALEDIAEAAENGHKVALVECVNSTNKNGIVEQEKIYRWFEVPEEWTKEMFEERLKEI